MQSNSSCHNHFEHFNLKSGDAITVFFTASQQLSKCQPCEQSPFVSSVVYMVTPAPGTTASQINPHQSALLMKRFVEVLRRRETFYFSNSFTAFEGEKVIFQYAFSQKCCFFHVYGLQLRGFCFWFGLV